MWLPAQTVVGSFPYSNSSSLTVQSIYGEPNNSTTADISLTRAAVGVWRIGNGSTGAGSLLISSSGGTVGAAALLTVGVNQAADALAVIQFNALATTSKVVVVQGLAGQTANLLEAQNSSGTALSAIDAGGNFSTLTAGVGLKVKSGSNARIGTGTLSGGTLAVANTSVTANTRVFLTDTTSGTLTNVGSLTAVINAGTGFTVNSTNVLDTSTFNWLLVESQ